MLIKKKKTNPNKKTNPPKAKNSMPALWILHTIQHSWPESLKKQLDAVLHLLKQTRKAWWVGSAGKDCPGSGVFVRLSSLVASEKDGNNTSNWNKSSAHFWVIGTEIWSGHVASSLCVQVQASPQREKPQDLLNKMQMTFTGPFLMHLY